MARSLKLLISSQEKLSTTNYLEVFVSSEIEDLVTQIEKTHGRDVPEEFYTYLAYHEEAGSAYGITNQTPYGDNLKYIKPKHLGTLPEMLIKDNTNYNRAIGEFLKHIPEYSYIALFWH